jgi:hypothetical protein
MLRNSIWVRRNGKPVLYRIIQSLVDLDRVNRPLALGKRRVEKVRGAKRMAKFGGGVGVGSASAAVMELERDSGF